MIRVTLIDPSTVPTTPWRNGSGATREIAVGPGSSPERFRWRFSLAEVAAPGPFSKFAGYDRRIALVSGAGMGLTVGEDARVVVDRSSGAFAFSGDSAAVADLIDGPVRDLNLITDRATCEGRLVAITETTRFAWKQTAFVLAVEGRWTARGTSGPAIPPGLICRLDSDTPDQSEDALVEGSGRALFATVRSLS